VLPVCIIIIIIAFMMEAASTSQMSCSRENPKFVTDEPVARSQSKFSPM
jgi:hypothetical protein